MKCADIHLQIDDYLDKQLSPLEQSAFESHISACTDCADSVDREKSLLLALRNLPVPEPSPDFEQRIFSEVRKKYKKKYRDNHRFTFAAGFATAALASLVIWFVSSTYMPEPSLQQPQIISVSMHQTQTVRLLFDSRSDIQQVNLSIDLPHNMELDGYPGQRGLSWQTRLHKGQNVLALPIIAIDRGQGTLIARLSYGDKVKTYSLLLKTTIEGAWRFQPDNNRAI